MGQRYKSRSARDNFSDLLTAAEAGVPSVITRDRPVATIDAQLLEELLATRAPFEVLSSVTDDQVAFWLADGSAHAVGPDLDSATSPGTACGLELIRIALVTVRCSRERSGRIRKRPAPVARKILLQLAVRDIGQLTDLVGRGLPQKRFLRRPTGGPRSKTTGPETFSGPAAVRSGLRDAQNEVSCG